MPYPLTTRMPNGLTNAAPWQTMGAAGLPDPSWAHQNFDDFDFYDAAHWTSTLVGTTPTIVSTPADGGAILVTISAGVADSAYLQRPVAGHKLNAGKDTFFKFAGILSDVINDVFYCGLIATSTTPLTAADGLYILKATGQAALSLVSVIGGVTTSTPFPFPASELLVAGTPFEVGFHVDTAGNVEAFFNPTTGSNPIGSSPRGYTAKLTAPALTQVLLNMSFGLLNSTAAARTMTVDYVAAITQR